MTIAALLAATLVVSCTATTEVSPGDPGATAGVPAGEPTATAGAAVPVFEPTPDGAELSPPSAQGEAQSTPPPAPGDPEGDDLDLFAEIFSNPGSIEPAPPPSGPNELIGGSTDRTAARVIRRDLEAAGHDLTGLGIDVFPIAGTTGSLLVLSADPDTALVPSDDDPGSNTEGPPPVEIIAVETLAIVDEYQLGVVQVALTYTDIDPDRGPYTATVTFSVDAFRRVVETNGNIFDEGAKLQLDVENEQ